MKNIKAMGAAKAGKQRGFTIIELVVVILLLGILTATALPRFLDISEEAHDAVVDGVQGALRTGLALYKANWFAVGQPVAALADWSNLVPFSSGFPVGTSGGVSTGFADLHSECEDIYDGIMDVAAGAPASEDAATAIAGVSEPTATSLTDADLVEARAAAVAGSYQIIATLTASNTCRYWYVGDAQRLTTGTTPYLEYAVSTGVVTQGN